MIVFDFFFNIFDYGVDCMGIKCVVKGMIYEMV